MCCSCRESTIIDGCLPLLFRLLCILVLSSSCGFLTFFASSSCSSSSSSCSSSSFACSTFAKVHLADMSRDELQQYDTILNEHDNEWDMYAWCVGQRPLPDYLVDSPVMRALVDFTKHKAIELKAQMPPLHDPPPSS